MPKMTPAEIQEINRQIMAGTYVHVEDEPEPEVTDEKPKRGRPRKQTEEVSTDE